MPDPYQRYFESILDSRYDPKEHGGYPLCGLIDPQNAPGDTYVCPDCGITWIKITQYGHTVWSTHELNDGQPQPEGAGND